MKHLVLLVLGITLAAGSCLAGEAVNLQEKNDRVGYSIGYQVGTDFRRQEIVINPEMVVHGIQDAMADSEPRLTPEQMRSILVEVQQRVVAAQQQKNEEMAAENLAAGRKFLAENGKKAGVVTLPSGLQYEIVEPGTGPAPAASDIVEVNYRGTLIDGTEFDSSYKRGQPAQFRVDGVIAGWTEALQLMHEGGKWRLFIPPELGYSSRQTAAIPPDSTLIFEVELLRVKKDAGTSESK